MCLFRRINPLPSWFFFPAGIVLEAVVGSYPPPAHADDDVLTGHNRHVTPDLRPSYWAKQTKNNNKLILPNFPGDVENTDSGSFCKMIKC